MTTASLLVFSGIEDPSIELTPEQDAKANEFLFRCLLSPLEDEEPHSGLGYSGIMVVTEGYIAFAYNGRITLSPMTEGPSRSYQDPGLENYVFGLFGPEFAWAREL